MLDPIRQDFDLEYWTLDQAAAHFGISKAGVRKMIREGLPAYFGATLVKPAEYVGARLARQKRLREARFSRRHDTPADPSNPR